MQQVNKKQLHRLFKGLFVGVCFIFGTIHWFSDINQQNLNMDEPVWVSLTEFYTYRKNHNWEKFQLTQTNTRQGWGSERNLLTDQPQGGKYLGGLVLGITSENPWEKEDLSWVYQKFSQMKLPTDQSLNQLQDYLGKPLIQSIEILRMSNSILGFVSIGIFSILVFLLTKNVYTLCYAFLITTFNPLLLNYLRKALTDSPSILMIILTGIFVWIGLQQLTKQRLSCLPLFLVAGIAGAVAASIKINGFFLLGLPIVLTIPMILSARSTHKKSFSLLACSGIIFISSFIAVFLFLEPVTWDHPFQGTVALFSARLTQQQRFFTAFQKIEYYKMPFFALNIFFSQFSWIINAPIFVFLAIGFTHLTSSVMKRKTYEIQIISSLLFLFGVNFYYARTGFDRYLIPSVFGLLFVSSIGFKIFLEKVNIYVFKTQSLL